MRIIDPHVHMTSRTTDDYEAMAAAGIVAIVEPAFWLGQPRTQVGSFQDYFASLVGFERFRGGLDLRHRRTEALVVGDDSEALGLLDHLTLGATAHWLPTQRAPQVSPIVAIDVVSAAVKIACPVRLSIVSMDNRTSIWSMRSSRYRANR